MKDQRIVCNFCGQDWLKRYQIRADGRKFLLCEECDSIWLPGDDTSASPRNSLDDLLASGADVWELIEILE